MPFSLSDSVEPESSTISAEPDLLHASSQPSMVSTAPVPELAYAASLAGASERMLRQPNLASLWPAVAAEAATLGSAHATSIVRYSGDEWSVVAAHQGERGPAAPDIKTAIKAAARHGWLREPTYINDLGRLEGEPAPERPLPGAGWGSLLVVSVACPHRQDSTRLVWFSRQLTAFGWFLDVAEVFSWHVSAAVRHTIYRENLDYAIPARSRIGQALGILMTRHGFTADQAFEALKHQSQNTNVKLRIIAECVINGGQLDQSQSRGLTRRP